jgi:hypothetical protein
MEKRKIGINEKRYIFNIEVIIKDKTKNEQTKIQLDTIEVNDYDNLPKIIKQKLKEIY